MRKHKLPLDGFHGLLGLASLALLLCAATGIPVAGDPNNDARLNATLTATLRNQGFTGNVGSSIEQRLGRKIDDKLANIGNLLWFDTIGGLNNDNTCGGCHSPTNGFGDTQSIAIGIDNNGTVGPGRAGPRNQRRTPMAANAAFFPTLMWNSRFSSLSGDPFDNSAGFLFTDPEGLSLSDQPELLAAHAFMPPTERTEVVGFTFDFPDPSPAHEHQVIRDEVIRRLNGIPAYRTLFGDVFPDVKAGGPITMNMFARAIAEFENTLIFANAPIDEFARGDTSAMTSNQKRGALLFFGKAGCVSCHAVSGQSNEMFSDFRQHVVGVPQIVPQIGNVPFDGPGANEDFGLEQVTGNPQDRYAFRTSPLRNAALQPAFFHNGCFTNLEDAIRHHLNVSASARGYTWPVDLASDLTAPLGPIEPVLAKVDPLLAAPINLSATEFNQLADFVRNGLLDEEATPDKLSNLVPQTVPSGRPVLTFQF